MYGCRGKRVTISVRALCRVDRILRISVSRLAACLPRAADRLVDAPKEDQGDPFFRTRQLCFCFCSKQCRHAGSNIVSVCRGGNRPKGCRTALAVYSISTGKDDDRVFCAKQILCDSVLVHFSFMGRCGPLRRSLLCVFGPLRLQSFAVKLLYNVSDTSLVPYTFGYMIALGPRRRARGFHRRLLFAGGSLGQLRRLGVLLIRGGRGWRAVGKFNVLPGPSFSSSVSPRGCYKWGRGSCG